MKYFLDTEFLEGTQKTLFNKSKPTIDLISIGIVSDDNREYYAISKDFNIKEAWNRFQLEQVYGDARNIFPEGVKKYWIRDNVLKPIFYELVGKDINFHDYDKWFTYNELKKLINKYGKTNKQIAEDILKFVNPNEDLYWSDCGWLTDEQIKKHRFDYKNMCAQPKFYGYYSDYDWVVFCWLFGKMNDLPNWFPMYCNDLQQMIYARENKKDLVIGSYYGKLENHFNYPKQINEHNALADAKWNKQLYEFLNTI